MLKRVIAYALAGILIFSSLSGCSLLPGGDKEADSEPVLTNTDIADEVIWHFLAMCKIPHTYSNEAALSANLEDKIKKMGYICVRDAQNNVIAEIPATPGYEGAPLTVLQGHMDMVSVAGDEAVTSGQDTRTVNAIVSGSVVQSDKLTALGADCNMANAAILYYIDNPDFVHGPLRVIFTTRGEENMAGAKGLDAMYLKNVKYLINVAGSSSDRIIDSGTASRRDVYTMPVAMEPAAKNKAFKIEISGFTGGHYGNDVWRNRGNALKMMADLLKKAQASFDFQLADIKAGGAINSIAGQCEATVIMDQYDGPAFERMLYETMYEIQEQYKKTEPSGALTYSVTNMPAFAVSADAKTKIIQLLNGLFDGIYRHSEEDANDVTASANLERVEIKDGTVRVVQVMRSISESDMQSMISRNGTIREQTGFSVQSEERRVWGTNRKTNDLLYILADAKRRISDVEMQIVTANDDSELPILLGKNQDMNVACIGLDIISAHTVNEYVKTESIGPFVRTLSSALQNIAYELPERTSE